MGIACVYPTVFLPKWLLLRKKKEKKLLNSVFNLPRFCAIGHRRRKIIVVIIKVREVLFTHAGFALQGWTDPIPIFIFSQAELLHEFETMKKSPFVRSDSGLLHRLNTNRISARASVLWADGLDFPCHRESHITENVTSALFNDVIKHTNHPVALMSEWACFFILRLQVWITFCTLWKVLQKAKH